MLPRYYSALRQQHAAIAIFCADDFATALRSARPADVAPVFLEAPRVAGRRLKLSNCKTMVVARSAPGERAQPLRDRLRWGAPEWGEFVVEPSGTYLGVPLGRIEAGAAWDGPR